MGIYLERRRRPTLMGHSASRPSRIASPPPPQDSDPCRVMTSGVRKAWLRRAWFCVCVCVCILAQRVAGAAPLMICCASGKIVGCVRRPLPPPPPQGRNETRPFFSPCLPRGRWLCGRRWRCVTTLEKRAKMNVNVNAFSTPPSDNSGHNQPPGHANNHNNNNPHIPRARPGMEPGWKWSVEESQRSPECCKSGRQ